MSCSPRRAITSECPETPAPRWIAEASIVTADKTRAAKIVEVSFLSKAFSPFQIPSIFSLFALSLFREGRQPKKASTSRNISPPIMPGPVFPNNPRNPARWNIRPFTGRSRSLRSIAFVLPPSLLIASCSMQSGKRVAEKGADERNSSRRTGMNRRPCGFVPFFMPNGL